MEEANRLAERADNTDYRVKNHIGGIQLPHRQEVPSTAPIPKELGTMKFDNANVNRIANANRPKKNYSNLTCYTCGKKGHTSKVCKQC